MTVRTTGPVALITGGASGIGKACARSLKAGGATVALLALPGPELAAAADELGAIPVEADVRDFTDVERVVDGLLARPHLVRCSRNSPTLRCTSSYERMRGSTTPR